MKGKVMRKKHYVLLVCLCLTCYVVMLCLYPTLKLKDEISDANVTNETFGDRQTMCNPKKTSDINIANETVNAGQLMHQFEENDTWESARERIAQIYHTLKERDPGAKEMDQLMQMVVKARIFVANKEQQPDVDMKLYKLKDVEREFLNQLIKTRKITLETD